MGRAELNLHVLSQSRRKSFLQGREFCLSAHSVIGSRARGGRVTPVGRTRLGRGAVEPRARGDDDQGEKNDFLRFQEQLLRRKKQKLFLGVSVGNGVRGGITLQAKSTKYFMPTSYFIASKLFLCPRIARMDTNLFQWVKWRPVRSHEFALMQ